MADAIQNWLKRHSRKTFYLYKSKELDEYRRTYYLIWNDAGEKTKYGPHLGWSLGSLRDEHNSSIEW
jgi:hypothetical protein